MTAKGSEQALHFFESSKNDDLRFFSLSACVLSLPLPGLFDLLL